MEAWNFTKFLEKEHSFCRWICAQTSSRRSTETWVSVRFALCEDRVGFSVHQKRITGRSPKYSDMIIWWSNLIVPIRNSTKYWLDRFSPLVSTLKWLNNSKSSSQIIVFFWVLVDEGLRPHGHNRTDSEAEPRQNKARLYLSLLSQLPDFVVFLAGLGSHPWALVFYCFWIRTVDVKARVTNTE